MENVALEETVSELIIPDLTESELADTASEGTEKNTVLCIVMSRRSIRKTVFQVTQVGNFGFRKNSHFLLSRKITRPWGFRLGKLFSVFYTHKSGLLW